MVGVYNGDPSIRSNDHHGADFSMDGPAFAIGEVAYQPNSLPGDRGLPGNYKAGFWYDNSLYNAFNTGAVNRGNWGLYGVFDQVLVRFGEAGSHRGFGVSGSFLASPDQSISQMPYFLLQLLLRVAFFHRVCETLSAWALSTVILAMTCRVFSGGRNSWIQMLECNRTRRWWS